MLNVENSLLQESPINKGLARLEQILGSENPNHLCITTDSSRINGWKYQQEGEGRKENEEIKILTDFAHLLVDRETRYRYSISEMRHIRLCIDEAYENAVIHGNKGGEIQHYHHRGLLVPTDLTKNWHKKISLGITLNSKAYIIEIANEGNTLIPTEVQSTHTLSQTGHGIQIIHKIMDVVFSYISSEKSHFGMIRYL